MAQLNYNHLYYFYITAREGSISRASEALHITPQTISGQITAFESYIGSPLFDRRGKRLLLNPLGKKSYAYAERIFAEGDNLLNLLLNTENQQVSSYSIGITDVVPKVLAFKLLHPVSKHYAASRFIYREGGFERLSADLALNRLDLILADHPPLPGGNIKAFSYPIGETGVSFYSSHALSQRLKSGFPASMDGQPLLITGDKSNLKLNLLSWFEQQGISPKIAAEFDDSALMKLFAQAGEGIFCTPSSVETHIEETYGVNCIGRTDEIRERYYLISARKLQDDPILQALIEQARQIFRLE